MGLKTAVTIFLAVFMLFPLLYGQTQPEERCVNDGDFVCTNCKETGQCNLVTTGPPTFNVSVFETCAGSLVCDSSQSTDGVCAPSGSSSCNCSGAPICTRDPNDPDVFFSCMNGEDATNIAPFTCKTQEIMDYENCTCKLLPETAPPEDRCVNHGDLVCMNCRETGQCIQVTSDPPTFTVSPYGFCIGGFACDWRQGTDGTCTPGSGVCNCDEGPVCTQDPNDPDSFFSCADGQNAVTITPFECAAPSELDNGTCTCLAPVIVPPEGRCVNDSDLVCVNCKEIGRCNLLTSDPPTFNVSVLAFCVGPQVCDSSLGNDGTCSDFGGVCNCEEGPVCTQDPNDPKTFFSCSSGEDASSITPFKCLPQEDVDNDICACYIVPPEQRCVNDGDQVCLSCKEIGRCETSVVDPPSFNVSLAAYCAGPNVCDSSQGTDGICEPSDGVCNCGNGPVCTQDPNNSEFFFSCANGENAGSISPFTCPAFAEVDSETCTCLMYPPEQRCISDGDLVCIHCKEIGACELVSSSPPTFNVSSYGFCVGPESCDSSIASDGICTVSGGVCNCEEGPVCTQDPNDPDYYFSCLNGEDAASIVPFMCTPPETVELNSCTCFANSTTTSKNIVPQNLRLPFSYK